MTTDASDSIANLLEEMEGLRRRLRELEEENAALKLLEGELRQSQETVRALTDAAVDSIFIKDANLRYTFVNPAMARTLGCRPSDLIGKTPEEVFGENDATTVASVDEAVLRGEVVNTVRTLTINDADRTFHTIQTPVFDPVGKVHAIYGIVRDVTKQRQAEQAARESEHQLSLLLQNMGDMVSRHLPDSTVTYASPSCRSLLGYEPEELVGRLAADSIHPEDVQDTMAIIKTAAERHVPHYRLEYRLKHKNGQHIWVETVGRLVYGADDNLIEIQCSVRDISERKRAEEALQQTYEQLEERVLERTKELAESNEQLLREAEARSRTEETLHRQGTALEQAFDGIAIANLDGYIQYANPAWAAMHGRHNEELVGQNLSVFHTQEQMDREVIPFLRLLMKRDGHNGRVGHVRKDGTTFMTAMSCGVFRNTDDIPAGILGIARDISGELVLEAQLRHAQKMEAVGVFAGGIAHNWRNHLANILGWIETTQERVTDDPMARTFLSRASRAARRAAEQVDQLLRYSRRTETKLKPVALGPVLEETLALLRNMAPTEIEIRGDLDPGCGPVMADPDEIQQVLINLGTNAFHAMEKGGVLEIGLAETAVTSEQANAHPQLDEGLHAQLTIRDTGHGMDEQTREHIFEPFFTTKEPGKGTGLGLSIIHRIVADHEGAIGVRSEVGRGTTVTILLPICPNIASDESEPTHTDARATRAQQSRHVLLVDDDQDFLDMARAGLELLGYSVDTHVSPAAALEAFRHAPHDFDVVVTDSAMPAIKGDDLIRRVRAIRPDTPTILVSGLPDEADGQTDQDADMDRRITKPVTPRELDAAIQRVLDRQ